jgi:hypothetical protein
MMPLAKINVKFMIDNETYEVDYFNISFDQPTDYKGQPQHEIKGGKITLRITKIPSGDLYFWASKSNLRKNGQILFQTDLGMTVLKVEFFNAYCINMKRKVSSYNGTSTALILSSEELKINNIEHNNYWVK